MAFCIAAGLGGLIWIVILLLPWRPWSTRERLHAAAPDPATDLSHVTVLIPARNEAGTLAVTMEALNVQGAGLKVVLIDDQSSDATADTARKTSRQELRVVAGQELPGGWAGKLWALEQGLGHALTPLLLLLDADIQIAPGLIAALARKMETDSYDLVSVMARLRMETFWEKLLMPAFIYFFKLLYPFAIGNAKGNKFGVAAGGCILLRREALEKIGGFSALHGALIDDCTLARKCKAAGFSTWIGLSHDVTSHRGYDDLSGIWNMVARSAFTQLRYSNIILLACTTIMLAMFLATSLGFLSPCPTARIVAFLGCIAMVASYLPTLLYYRKSPLWAFALPIAGMLYLGMTWTSALRYWRGKRAEWKGRVYAKALPDIHK
jgi:hopene-associated glycosyltransferase HpnB